MCEELPDPNFINQRGSRFVHAYFNKRTGEFTHFDGSIRIFSEKEIYERISYEIKDVVTGHVEEISVPEVRNFERCCSVPSARLHDIRLHHPTLRAITLVRG